MTAALDLARTLQRNEAAMFRGSMISDPRSKRRFGFTLARRGEAVCLGSRGLPGPLFHRAIGFGVSAPPTAATLAAILRHYSELQAVARVELAEGIVPEDATGLLRRHGFRRERAVHVVHVLVTDRAPEVRPVRDLTVEAVGPDRAGLFGRLARVGFEEKGERGDFVERSSAFVLSHGTSRVRYRGYIGRIAGAPAATGLVCLTDEAGGLYSDSTHPDFRGRGIQKAMIAERIRRGLHAGRRIFTARTEGPNTSARNYEQTGFTPLYRASFWARPTD